MTIFQVFWGVFRLIFNFFSTFFLSSLDSGNPFSDFLGEFSMERPFSLLWKADDVANLALPSNSQQAGGKHRVHDVLGSEGLN